ncbi:MAG TPA: glycerophosphodiester phosphodiesterase family protein [Myxococcota bacterium]|nr:glycerophosphodiester phosphodiesterase family protein [Myxococcota bacterium]
MRRLILRGLLALLVLVALGRARAAWVDAAAPDPDGPYLLAHRGVAQSFDHAGLTSETCTATRIDPPRHALIENTLPSIEAAFALGAERVEIDVHPTTDGHFVVFHDWTLDCRTEGHGVTREHALAELRGLDVGYGYTADGGRTFPLRGHGVGMMPTLDEVLARFPDRHLLINVKSDDPDEGRQLAAVLAALPASRRSDLAVYGGDRAMAALHAALPDVAWLSRASLKACGLRYLAVGWAGFVPEACRTGLVFLPVNAVGWMWGGPEGVLRRMTAAGDRVYLLGPWTGGSSEGIDDPALVPAGWRGGISTDAIDRFTSAR